MSIRPVHVGWMVAALCPVLALAQAGKLVIPDFEELAKKASEVVDITLDGDSLKSASHLMGASGSGPAGDVDIPGLVRGLKSVTVRSYTFDKADMYSQKDVDGVLAQVNVPGWKKVISVREKGERVEIHMRDNAEDGGVLIVSEEPKELTIVNIAGRVSLDQLRDLQGHMGVPEMPDVIGEPTPPPPPPAQPSRPAAVPSSTRGRVGPGI